MPKSTKQELEYQKAYNAKPENVKKRVANNAARREAIKAGKASVGDGKEVAHKRALNNGGSNSPSNLEVQDGRKNAGWRKGQKGYKVPNEK